MVNPTPYLPAALVFNNNGIIAGPQVVRQAEASLVNYNYDTIADDLLADLLYTDVGGVELASLARHDTVDGQPTIYSLVKKLSELNKTYDPNRLLAGQPSNMTYFSQFAIDMSGRVPNDPVSLDAEGNMIIEVNFIGENEYLDIEISDGGNVYEVQP